MRSGGGIKLYVVPLTHLRTVSYVYLPIEGKYAVGNSHKPRKDWTRYEEAWHLIGRVSNEDSAKLVETKVHT